MSALLAKQQLASQTRCVQRAPCPSRRAVVRVCAASKPEEKSISSVTGFIDQDNSGKANIYPAMQKPFVREQEPVAQGLGGASGLFIIAAGVFTVFVAAGFVSQAPEAATLQQVASELNGDSLSAMAARISATL